MTETLPEGIKREIQIEEKHKDMLRNLHKKDKETAAVRLEKLRRQISENSKKK